MHPLKRSLILLEMKSVLDFFASKGVNKDSDYRKIAATMYHYFNQGDGQVSYDSNDQSNVLDTIGLTNLNKRMNVEAAFRELGTPPEHWGKYVRYTDDDDAVYEAKVLTKDLYNQPEYAYYLVQFNRKDGIKIIEGFEYKEDAVDRGKEIKLESSNNRLQFKVLTSKGLSKYDLNKWSNDDWANPDWEANIEEAQSQGTIEVDDESKAKDLARKGFNVSLSKKGTTKAMGLKPKTSTMFEDDAIRSGNTDRREAMINFLLQYDAQFNKRGADITPLFNMSIEELEQKYSRYERDIKSSPEWKSGIYNNK